MSRTYRRKKEPIRIEKCHMAPWQNSAIYATSGYGYDKLNTLYISLESQEDAEAPWVERAVARHFSDSGTRKDFRGFKHILKKRYRAQCREKQHHALKQEDGELQLNTFTTFDTGIWWD